MTPEQLVAVIVAYAGVVIIALKSGPRPRP